eukprot:6462776-Amphidinium_carterae.1
MAFRVRELSACVDGAFQEEMRLAVAQVHASFPQTVHARSLQLYALLASHTASTERLVRALRAERNGYEPHGDKLWSTAEELQGHQPEQFHAALLRWEEKIRRYEEFPGAEQAVFDESLKKAILLQKAPPEMQTYLRVYVTDGTSYPLLRDKVEHYLRGMRKWNLADTTPVPMD